MASHQICRPRDVMPWNAMVGDRYRSETAFDDYRKKVFQKTLEDLHIEGSPCLFQDHECIPSLEAANLYPTWEELCAGFESGHPSPDGIWEYHGSDAYTAEEIREYEMDGLYDDFEDFLNQEATRDNLHHALAVEEDARGDSSTGFDNQNRLKVDAKVVHVDMGYALALTPYGITYINQKMKHRCTEGCSYMMVVALSSAKMCHKKGALYMPKHPLVTLYITDK